MKKKTKRILLSFICCLFVLLGLFSVLWVFISQSIHIKVLDIVAIISIFFFTAYGFYNFFMKTINLIKYGKSKK